MERKKAYIHQQGDAFYLSITCTWLFQKNFISFTWKYSQESSENIPHSAPMDIARDFTEGPISQTGQMRLE
jgi:hypothetical protein